ncbi:efflux RND transporter periplasmic adaptor subunit [Nitrosomonas sp.]|uniref:efflux RND transporter periplasmic adaptor subunit n=1 Tax=Nitrosomonas sp. TaxID=42353 RepID=UPI00284753ED|nr:efflux RND transporter periplasmic adaptor subunit [Nitrosomonas sp.]MDR4515777.1 efflux RND transporter periplasmic adaptor subunit [Nitrosomonas sp.]
MKPRRQIVIASCIFLIGGLAASLLIKFPSQSDQQETVIMPPVVQVVQIGMQSKRLHVRSQGRVTAHTEIDLVTEVAGRIIDLSPTFVSGGFFRQGDVLATIDPADYDLQIAQAQAQVKEAHHLLTREEAEAIQARDEWEHLGQGDPSPLNLRMPQLAEMRAKLAAAKKALEYAKQLRLRTQIRAPFDGRVRSKNIGIGQFVTQNSVLGVIYGSGIAEIRLPVSVRDLAFIDLPGSMNAAVTTDSRNRTDKQSALPHALLTADYLGKQQIWRARIVRSEGLVGRNTGMVTLVAQIIDPFKRQPDPTNSANPVELPLGLFVEALIQGRRFDRLAILPASAVFGDDQVAVVDRDNRLRLRTVQVLKRERGQVMIQSGLKDGERILVSGLLHPIDGMAVTPELSSRAHQAAGGNTP